jgi:DNA polymerase-3 subunit beta
MLTKTPTLAASIDRDELVAALASAARFTEKRNSIPILDCVLIQNGPDGLTLTTTDLDVTLCRQVAAASRGHGAVAVSIHTFLKLAKNLPAGPVSIEQTGESLTIEAGRATLRLPTKPPEDFPSDPRDKLLTIFTLAATTLRELIERTKVAISQDETRYYLKGIFFNVRGETLRAVSTDGHRLAMLKAPLPAGAELLPTCYDIGQRPGFILPRKTCLELLPLLKGLDGRVSVQFFTGKSSRVVFSGQNWEVASKVIDGAYPDYARVIPSDGDALTFDVVAFGDVLARVSAIQSKGRSAFKMELAQSSLTVSAFDAENGAASETMDASWAGQAMEIGFNAGYFRDMLAQMTGPEMRVMAREPASPVRIEDPADASVMYVLMPLRV